MDYLVVGLGNPGKEYALTRHNVGFQIVESLAEQHHASFQSEKYAQIAQIHWRNRNIIAIKPTTYMNLSGKAVRYWMQKKKIAVENILVITDDIALPFGKLRLKGKGSDGGHNGLKDIQHVLTTQTYARLRFGVGNEFQKGRQVDFVLGEWTAQELSQLNERINTATKFIQSFVSVGLNQTMSDWNNKGNIPQVKDN